MLTRGAAPGVEPGRLFPVRLFFEQFVNAVNVVRTAEREMLLLWMGKGVN